jgi:hypothetical protein
VLSRLGGPQPVSHWRILDPTGLFLFLGVSVGMGTGMNRIERIVTKPASIRHDCDVSTITSPPTLTINVSRGMAW